MAGNVSDRLLDAAGIQVDRLPMLPIIFDRVATACSVGCSTLPARIARIHERAERRRRLSTESWIGCGLPRSSSSRYWRAIV